MTQSQQHQPVVPSRQQQIVEETTEEWADLIEDEDEENRTFAEALKGWYDTQMLDLHDSRGDAEYQKQQVEMLQSFRTMIEQIKQMDFGFDTMDAEIREETK